MRVLEGGSVSDDTVNRIAEEYINNIPVAIIKKKYGLSTKKWNNIHNRIVRQTNYSLKPGRPAMEINHPYVSKKGKRYNITYNNIDFGCYMKNEITEVLKLLEDVDYDYDTWMSMREKNIPVVELQEYIYNLLSEYNVLSTREISNHINKDYGKFYSVEYCRTILRRWSGQLEWLDCINFKGYHNSGIPLKWRIKKL